MLALVVALQARLLTRSGSRYRLRPHGEAGQATAEYAIVLLAAAGVAFLVVKWATKTSLIGKLLEAVIDLILGKIT